MKQATFSQAKKSKTVLIDARAEPTPALPRGPFVTLGDGRILTISGNRVLISGDRGKTWSSGNLPLPDNRKFAIRNYTLLRTREGTLIYAFGNEAEEKGKAWKNGEPPADSQLPVYVMRSLDDGMNWQAPQRIDDGWSRDTRCIIQLKSGRIALASSKSVPNPGRQQALCLLSDDDGKSWKRSEPIDLGDYANPRPGQGDAHDGAHHGTLVELRDGRLWMLLSCRKGLGQAYSHDGGMTWKDMGPYALASAGFAPATLVRLQSGRLIRFWQPKVEEKDPFPAAKSARLVLALSDDDGRSWSAPILLVHDLPPAGTPAHTQWREHVVHVADLFEPIPGTLWISTHRPAVRLQLRERDLVR